MTEEFDDQSYRNTPFDPQTQKEGLKGLLPAEAVYTTVPPLRPDKVVGQAGNDLGRTMYSFYGEMRREFEYHSPETGETKVLTATTRQAFKLAPGKRPGAGPREPKYRMWVQAGKLFKAENGRDPVDHGELIDYVANTPVRVKLAHFTPEDGDPKVFFNDLYGVRRG